MKRVRRIREQLSAHGADVFLCTNPVNRRYLTGFTGSAGTAWISADRQIIMTDFRYIEQVKAESPDWELVRIENLNETLKTLIDENDIGKIAFEADNVTVQRLEQWKEKLEVEFIPVSGWVEELRSIKTEQEIENIRQAAKIGDQAFAELLPKIRSGVSEIEIALELEFLMRRAGASGMSFSPIIASGPQSALPHARPSERILMYGDFVVFDFGCIVNGYCSDMTRTIVIGEPEEQHLLIYDLVLKAQLESLAAVAPEERAVKSMPLPGTLLRMLVTASISAMGLATVWDLKSTRVLGCQRLTTLCSSQVWW